MKIVIQKIIHFWVLMLKRQLPITIFNSTLLFITHIELWSIVHYYFIFHTQKCVYIYVVWGPRTKEFQLRNNLHNLGEGGKMNSEDSIWSRRVIVLGQLLSLKGPSRGKEMVVRTRIVRGSFLKGIPPTSAFNTLHQPYQLH